MNADIKFEEWVKMLEVDEKRKKVMRNRYYEKFKKGKYVTGKPPFGYDVDKNYDYTKNEQIKIMQEMFELAERGLQYKGLQQYLKDVHNITSGKNPLKKITIFTMLRNPIYCGKFAFQRNANIDGKTYLIPRSEWLMLDEHFEHLAIVKEDTFENVMMKMENEWEVDGIPFVKDLKKNMYFM